MTFAANTLPGLMLWLKADALAQADNSAVSSWTDSSGFGSHATQATGANQPTLQTNEVNSLPVIRFDGSNDFLNVPAITLTNRNAATVYVVFRAASFAAVAAIFENGTDSFTTAGHFGLFGGTDNRAIAELCGSVGPTDWTHDAILGTSQFSLASCRFQRRFPRQQAEVIVNGACRGSTTVFNRNAFPATLLTQASYIGARAGTSLFFNGDIAEILFYRRLHTPTQRLVVEDYLATKYAITTVALDGVLGIHAHSAYEGDNAGAAVQFNESEWLHSYITDNYELRNTSRNGSTNDYTPGAVALAGNQNEDAGVHLDPWWTPGVVNIALAGNAANDLYNGASVAVCEANHQRLALERQAAGWSVVSETILPLEGFAGTPVGFETDRQTINTWTRANYATFADALSDMGANDKIGDFNDNLDTTYYSTDHAHLSQLGYRIHARILEGVASSAFGVDFAFDASTMTGCLWWFKADSYVGSDGDLVSTWSDSSGNAKHATAAGTARPTYKTNIMNGQPVMRFDGTSDVLTIPATDMTGTSTLTLYVVASVSGAALDQMIVENGPNSSTDTDGFMLVRVVTSNHAYAQVRTTVNSDFESTDALSSTPKLIRTVLDKTLATNEVTVSVNLSSAGTRTNNNDNAGAFGNQTSFIGARNAASIFFAGDIAEIVLFNRALTAREHKRVEHYLDRKYALYWTGAPT